MPTLSAISTIVAGACIAFVARSMFWSVRCGDWRTAPMFACSGQRMPTGAKFMHSSQIGRPHSEHETRVSRPGWR
jgi:hypothetical protein